MNKKQVAAVLNSKGYKLKKLEEKWPVIKQWVRRGPKKVISVILT